MPHIISASTVIGDPVANDAGDDLGKIEEVMLNTSDGSVAYAVLSFGGVLGIGDKLFAIPWKQLTLDAEKHRFLLNLPREALESAPGFDKDNWPDFSDAGWSQEISAYYGRTA